MSTEQIREAELGEQSPKLASSLGNLGGLLESMGRYNEAESLYRQVLNIRTAIHKVRFPWVGMLGV